MPNKSNNTFKPAITMPHIAWVLLGKYLAVINYDRIKRGQKIVDYRQLLGAIVSRVLVDHGHGLERSFEEVWLSSHKEDLPNFYSTDQLAAIASASRTDIPNVYRTRYSSRKAARQRAETRRALCRVAQRSKGFAARSARITKQVRGGGLFVGTGFSVRKKED